MSQTKVICFYSKVIALSLVPLYRWNGGCRDWLYTKILFVFGTLNEIMYCKDVRQLPERVVYIEIVCIAVFK